MLQLNSKLFRYQRTLVALNKWRKAMEKFLTTAAADRYAVVGMVLMDTAADLLERIGYTPIAVELRGRVAQLQTVAEQAVMFGKRGARTKRAIGVNLPQEQRAQRIIEAAPGARAIEALDRLAQPQTVQAAPPQKRRPGRPRRQVETVGA